MKKFNLLMISLVMVLVIIGLILGMNLTGQTTSEFPYDYELTKAICEGNSCQDFKITCKDNEVMEMVPLTGLITFSDSWKDPRLEEEREDLCGR
ncbi:MAG: hypothetical protein ACE5ES_03665 [Candidatus Nanoarchaeia archaeon]